MEHDRKVISASKIIGTIALIFASLVCLTVPAHAANTPPQLGTITPSSGTFQTNIARSFTTTYIDPNGYADIRYAYLLINSSLTSSRGFYAYYNQTAKMIYLLGDTGTWIGGYAPGSMNVMQNSYVKIDCSKTTVSGSGTTLSISWNITFKATFAGTKNAYMYVSDGYAGAGWTQKGTWRINNPPQVGTLTPSSGTFQPNTVINFTTTYIDPDGYANIRYAYLLINSSLTSSKGFYAYYNQTAKMIYLLSDAGTWLGGYAPGSANILENSYVKLDCSKTTVSGSGQTLSLNWNIIFKSTFTGTKNVYMYVSDAYVGTGWAQKGTWTIVGDTTPPTGSIKINNDQQYANSLSATLILLATDNAGGSGIDQMKFSTDNINWTTAEPYAQTKSFSLPSGDGTKNVYVKFSDKSGNWSSAYSESIILDATPPAAPIVNAVTSPTNLVLQTITGTKSIDTSTIVVTCSTATVGMISYPTSTTWSCPLSNLTGGANAISVTAADAAGNVSTAVQVTIILNGPPQVGTISPSAGSSRANIEVNFTTTYTDPDGPSDIRYAGLLINTTVSPIGCFYGYYWPGSNTLYVWDDSGHAMTGGYAPGSSNIIENSYAKLDCSKTTVSRSGNMLTVNWSVTFKSTFIGAKNAYLYVADNASAVSGWIQKGTWTVINQAPQIGTVTPSSGYSGVNQAVAFTTTYSDPDGYQDISSAEFLVDINSTDRACYYRYDPSLDRLFLFDPSTNQWSLGYAPGSPTVLENNYAKLDCSKTIVSKSGTTLTVNWPVAFKGSFLGTKNTYLKVTDKASATTGWVQIGLWYVYNQPPEARAIDPTEGRSNPNEQVFITTTYYDANGAEDINRAELLVSSSLIVPSQGAYLTSLENCVYVFYNRNENKLYMIDHQQQDVPAGGFAPGSNNIIENFYAKLDCSKTTVSVNGGNFVVKWAVTFKSSFPEFNWTYLKVTDNASSATDWINMGFWSIYNQVPTADSVSPYNGVSNPGETVTFTATYSDPDGWQNLRRVELILTPSIPDVSHGFYQTSFADCLYAFYLKDENKLYIVDSPMNEQLVGGYAPGSNNIIENNYVRIDCSKTTVSGSGNTMTVNWAVTFKQGFTGFVYIYISAFDYSRCDIWERKGLWVWTVPNHEPSVGTVTPQAAQASPDQPVTFTTTYLDPDSWRNIRYAQLLINTSTGQDKCLLAQYCPVTNLLYLMNDGGTKWIEGKSPGSTGIIENSFARIDCSKTTVSASGNTLTINWAISLKASFTGTKNAYLSATDLAQACTGFIQKAVLRIGMLPTAAFSANPVSGNAPFAVSFTDSSTGGVNGYLWDFGDGQTSTEKNPSHTYSANGWDIDYNACELPQESNSGWIRKSVNNLNVEEVENGSLHVLNDFLGNGLSYWRSVNLKSDKEYTVEVKFRRGISGFPMMYDAMCLLASDDVYSWKMEFTRNGVLIGYGTRYSGIYSLDAVSDYHVYRAVAKDGLIDFYIDGIKKDTVDMTWTRGSHAPKIEFGTFSGGSGPPPGTWYEEGFWDYIRIRESDSSGTTKEKYYPVSLTASGSGGDDVIKKSNLIHVITKGPSIVTANMPDCAVGQEYSEYLNAADGIPPYIWSIDSGNLPEGLSLDGSTGKISGSPKTVSVSNFTAKVTDSNMLSAVKALSIKVVPVSIDPDEQLLDETEARAALYFYNEALSNGFVKDGNHKDFSSIAATGFGLASLCVMAERYSTTANWTVTPAQAKTRVNQILDECIRIQNLQTSGCNEYGTAGFLYHFITQDGAQQPGSEISTIDMALFLVGAITAGEYFGLDVKNKVNQIVAKLNWNYFLVTSKKQFSHGCYYGGSLMPGTWDRPGDEAILVSLMALTTEPENRSYLDTMYSWPRKVGQYGSYKVVNSYFGSLFTYIFANCYFDFQKLGPDNPLLAMSSASPVDWWANSVNAAYANRQFCIDHSVNYASYGPDSWGITACEYPNGGYAALLGAAPCEYNSGRPIHDGTIAPYGAISCMPFMRTSLTENLGDNPAFKALKYFHDTYYNNLWGPYGPRDSFNQKGEFNPYYYGLDLGSIVIMAENYRTRLVWDTFMNSEKIKAATAKVFGQGGELPPPVTLYVDVANSADPNQDGSQAHPFDHVWKVFYYTDGNNCVIQFAPGQYEYSGIAAEGKFRLAIKGVIGNRSDPLNTTVNTVFVGSSINIVRAKFTSIENLVMTTCVKDYYGNQGPAGSYGGAIYVESCDSLLINNCIFLNNLANKGSAIYCGNSKTVIVSNSLFRENRGHQSGTIHIFSDSYNPDWLAEINNNEIINNYAWVCGAGIQVENSNVSIAGNLVYNNRADTAAGLYLSNAHGEVVGNLIVKNFADFTYGGGIYCSESPVSINNNVIYKNRAIADTWRGAGGMLIFGAATPVVANNIISGNTAQGIKYVGTSSIALNYNNVYGNGGADYVGCQAGVGSISKPPIFVAPDIDGDDSPYNDIAGNPYNDDYHLQQDSPCINAGDPDIKFNDVDGTRNDAGIYGGPTPYALDGK